jgi:hypothetical protein
MIHRTLTRAAGAAALALTFVAGGAVAASAAAPPSLLFVQNASGGRIAHLHGDRFRLTLDGVTDVDVFTDRPSRRASSESARSFVSRWRGRGFAADAPNAALEIAGAPRGHDVAVVTLSHPRYDGRRQTLSYDAVPLRGRVPSALSAFAKRRDPVRQLRFGRASLFVDDGSSTTVMPVTFSITGLQASTAAALALQSGGVQFATSAPATRGSGLTVEGSPQGSPFALSQLLLTPTELQVYASAGTATTGLLVRAYLSVPANAPASVSVGLEAPPQVVVQASVGDGEPTTITAPGGTLTLGLARNGRSWIGRSPVSNR